MRVFRSIAEPNPADRPDTKQEKAILTQHWGDWQSCKAKLPRGHALTLVDYLSMQFPNVDAGAHMTTANDAIALAQKDIVTTFIKRKTASHQ